MHVPVVLRRVIWRFAFWFSFKPTPKGYNQQPHTYVPTPRRHLQKKHISISQRVVRLPLRRFKDSFRGKWLKSTNAIWLRATCSFPSSSTDALLFLSRVLWVLKPLLGYWWGWSPGAIFDLRRPMLRGTYFSSPKLLPSKWCEAPGDCSSQEGGDNSPPKGEGCHSQMRRPSNCLASFWCPLNRLKRTSFHMQCLH